MFLCCLEKNGNLYAVSLDKGGSFSKFLVLYVILRIEGVDKNGKKE